MEEENAPQPAPIKKPTARELLRDIDDTGSRVSVDELVRLYTVATRNHAWTMEVIGAEAIRVKEEVGHGQFKTTMDRKELGGLRTVQTAMQLRRVVEAMDPEKRNEFRAAHYAKPWKEVLAAIREPKEPKDPKAPSWKSIAGRASSLLDTITKADGKPSPEEAKSIEALVSALTDRLAG